MAPSIIYDALRHVEEKGISPEESWMEALKKTSGSALLGAMLECLARSFAHACYPISQLQQRLYVT